MRPSVALGQHRDEVIQIIAKYPKLVNPRVFGSVLHGDDVDGSDLDLLVDPLPEASLFDLGGLQDDLHMMLGVPVDVLTPNSLPIKFRERVLAEAIPV